MKNTEIRHAIDAVLSAYEVSDADESKLLKHILAGQCSKKRSFTRKTAITISAALLLAALLTSAVGIPDLQVFSKKTDEVLAYQVEKKMPLAGVFVAEEPTEDVAAVWGEEVAKGIIELNAAVHLPEWKPERFINVKRTSIRMDEIWGGTIDVYFETEDGKLLDLSVHIFPEDGNYSMSVFVEHDNTENKTWTYNGIEYSYLRNYEHHSLNWMEGNCRVSISGSITQEECHEMVKSIYD